MKKLTALLVLPIMALICSCGTQVTNDLPEPTGELTASFLKTGKSDAIVLQTAEHTAVIDCGEKDDGKKVVEELTAAGTDTVDYLFITHFDKDHVGGAAKVIEKLNVNNIYVPDYTTDSEEYTAFIDAAAEKGYEITTLTDELTFTVDDCVFTVYPPQETKYDEPDNDFSLAIRVAHGEDSMFFAGDAEDERIAEITKLKGIESTLLKVPHHGVLAGNTSSLLGKIRPKFAVITCSEKNPADEEVEKLVQTAGCELYETKNGTITAVSSGHGIEVTQLSE